jgi:hypothetical protein
MSGFTAGAKRAEPAKPWLRLAFRAIQKVVTVGSVRISSEESQFKTIHNVRGQ